MAPKRRLTHVGPRGTPRMVDVGGKRLTCRSATAAATVTLPPVLARQLGGGDLAGPKGPVFQAAILAGIMGAKRTSELIPLCHPIALDACDVTVEVGRPAGDGSVALEVRCTARTEERTGVEMEALTGAVVAALTIYDMGKALTHGITIGPVRLLEKTGGKKDYRAR